MAALPPRPRPAPPKPPAAAQPPVASKPLPAVRPAPMPGTPTERAEVLVSVMERLGALLARELDAARCRRYAEITALQGEKRDLTKRLDEIGRLVRLDRTGLAALAPDLTARLKDSGERLGALILTSAETLMIQAEAQKWVVDVAVKGANQKQRADTAYGKLQRGFAPRAVRAGAAGPTTFSATL